MLSMLRVSLLSLCLAIALAAKVDGATCDSFWGDGDCVSGYCHHSTQKCAPRLGLSAICTDDRSTSKQCRDEFYCTATLSSGMCVTKKNKDSICALNKECATGDCSSFQCKDVWADASAAAAGLGAAIIAVIIIVPLLCICLCVVAIVFIMKKKKSSDDDD